MRNWRTTHSSITYPRRGRDLRFRELQGESVHDAIQSKRLGEVKRRLLSTRDSIEKISADCGWDNINSLKNLFHKATGKSMREWRASPV